MDIHKKALFLLLVWQVSWLFSSPLFSATAIPVITEFEPNETPQQAVSFSAPAILSGSMFGDDQDAFLWHISDADALKRWDITLHGIPEALTGVSIVRVKYGADPNVSDDKAPNVVLAYEKLLTFGIRDGSRPVSKQNVFFPAGDYLVGLFQAGTKKGFQPPNPSKGLIGIDTNKTKELSLELSSESPNAYRLIIKPGQKTYFPRSVAHKTKQTAFKVKLGSSYSMVVGGDSWYSFKIDKENIQSLWTIKGEVMLERQLSMTLYKNNEKLGEAKSDKIGHFFLPNLALPEGEYFVQLHDDNKKISTRSLRIIETGAVIEGSEKEPNNSWEKANIIDLNNPLNARIDKSGEYDYFKFSTSEEEQSEVFQLTLDKEDKQYIKFCVLNDEGESLSCRAGVPPLKIDSLNFSAGVHGIMVGRSEHESAYTITRKKTGKVKAGRELEPNDSAATATIFGKKRLIKGFVSDQDTDYFTLYTNGKPQLWRLQAIGKNLRDLSGAGMTVRQHDSSRLRLDNLYLLPGAHKFSLSSGSETETKYVLRAIPLGPPNPEMEREPNNDLKTAQKIDLGSKRIGLLAESDDRDSYRFYLPAKQELLLELTVPPEGIFDLNLYLEGKKLKEFRSISKYFKRRLLLEPGDYNIEVKANKTSEVEYELMVKQDFGLEKEADIEPNGSVSTANAIPPSWVLSGQVGDSYYSYDFYRIPKLKKPLLIRLSKNKSNSSIGIYDDNSEKITDFVKIEADVFEATLPADKEIYFKVSGEGKYRYDISFKSDDISIKSPLSILPLEMEIKSETDKSTVAAYRNIHQKITFEAKIKNPTSTDITASFEVDTSDDKWIGKLEEASKIIPANKTVLIPITVLIKPDAWPDIPVTLRLIARDSLLNKASIATYALKAKRFAIAKNPHFDFKPPKNLQGSINVATTTLGAKILTDKVLASLTDGMATIGNYFLTKRVSSTGRGIIQPIIQLAGKQASDIIGFSFHPFGTQAETSTWGYARKVKVELSMDGKQFDTALITKLSGHTKEQFFSLDKPISARYARLTLLESPTEHVILGNFKVLASPNSLKGLETQNIALPKLGGHVVWLNPAQPKSSYRKTMLTPKEDYITTRVYKGERHEWVIGFHHNRAALIDSIAWINAKDLGIKRYIKTDVLVSTDSPLGPWKKIGSWQLNDDQQHWKLDKSVWARFVKFVAEPHPKQLKGGRVALPEQIIINEVQSDSAKSILAEWGHNSSQGAYEATHPPTVFKQENNQPLHTNKDNAQELESKKAATSQVQLGKYKNWYRVTIPEGQNSLSIKLTGYPSVGVIPVLQNTKGEELPWIQQKQTLQTSEYQAYAPSGEYYIRVEEPPRSVVFTWDTSGSTNNVRPIIRQAVLKYIADVKPGIDEAQMLPFGGGFLSDRWLDQPYMLQTILNDYNGSGNSSAAETALVQASEKLRNRPGKKIIVLITDAATTSDSALWKTLSEVRPRIIAIGVSSTGALSSSPIAEQDLLQDWAWSSNGYYEYTASVGAVERAFDRASSKIRQPTEYQIEVTTALKEPPKPGFLEVVSTSKKKSAITIKLPAPTIEVILDASGSMFSQMGKQRRYQVARKVLVDLVGKQLPNNANFGLRVFGHKEAGSCRTDLEIPIKRLNRKKAIQKIKKIAPKSYAKTPIAASLAAAAGDLKKIKGEKTILLITDGKETCNGDPEKAIAKLKESGIDTTVNIIGFAINDDALEAKFRRWAKSGGGEYQPALDGDALLKSIKKLSSRKFTVIGAGGEIKGEYSTGGKPIELSVGEYQLDFGNKLTKKIRINQGKTLTVKVGK